MNTKIYNNSLLLPLLALATMSLFFARFDNVLPVLGILEVSVIFYAISMLIKRSGLEKKTFLIQVLGLVYVILSFFYAVIYKGANLFDFIMIFKAFIYILILTILVKKNTISFISVKKFYYIILILFFIKYLSLQIFNISDRPTVFIENNFELMLLYALYLIVYSVEEKVDIPGLFLIGLITILSFSRSSLLMYGIVLLFVAKSDKKFKILVVPVAAISMAFVIYLIFSSRNSSIEEIDRYKFFLVFLENVKDWNIFQFLIGAERITPLSDLSCKSLSFYEKLFSYNNDGSCYSVILHSYLFRVIFDHGIFGLVYITYSSYYMLFKSNVPKNIAWVFIGIVIINGLSVSSFNNVFFAISMALLMTTNYSTRLGKRKELARELA